MNASTLTASKKAIVYPDSDGKPMADNTLQFRWIVTIEGGLDALYANDPQVFVAGDLLWYPVEGQPAICQAPDTLVVFGRPKGERGSYKQWEEGGIAPQVVFEILSPNNTIAEMMRKGLFYERYGVEEYYQFDPDNLELLGWVRIQGKFEEIPKMNGWVSPRLKIRFEVTDDNLRILGPDGRAFATFVEVVAQREQAERERELARREKDLIRREKEQAQREKELMELGKKQAEMAKEQAEREKEQALKAVQKLQAQLKALGGNPEN